VVRDSVAARRVRATAGTIPTQADLLKLWAIKEEAATPPPPRQTISLKPTVPPPPPPAPVLRVRTISKAKPAAKSVAKPAAKTAAPKKVAAKR
jgi:hypothetical protein